MAQINATNVNSNNNNTNNNSNNQNNGVGSEAGYHISDEDLDDCENLDDDCMLDESGELSAAAIAGRGPYERAWTTEATRALIHIRGPMEGNFTEGRQKRTALWLHCTRQLQRMGYRYSAAKVQKKWHNILITYNKNLSKKYLSGYVHWEFFEEMFKYLQGKKADFEQQQPQQTVPKESQQLPQQPETPKLQIKQQPVESVAVAITSSSTSTNCQPYVAQMDKQLLQQQLQQQQQQIQQQEQQQQMNSDTKSNDEFDEDSTTMSEVRQPKLEYDAEQSSTAPLDQHTSSGYEEAYSRHELMPLVQESHDNAWWKDYFERKLQLEREKIDLTRTMHRETLQVNKMSLVQQERIERLKIEAINSLTATLQKLVEVKHRKA